MIRTIWVLAVGGVLTMVLSARILWARWRRPEEVETVCENLGRYWARTVLRMAGARVRVEGHEAVGWDLPLVVVANHQSWFDVFALEAFLPGKVRFVAKKELSRIPIFGRAWQTCGHISLDRGDRTRAISSLDEAGRRVRDGSLTMILFPEGTRSWDGELQPFKKGAFVLAIKAGVPVVPVGIRGTRDVMPKGSFRIRPAEVRIRVGRPIDVETLGHGHRDRLMERSREAVAALMADGPTDHESPADGATTSENREETG